MFFYFVHIYIVLEEVPRKHSKKVFSKLIASITHSADKYSLSGQTEDIDDFRWDITLVKSVFTAYCDPEEQ